MNCTVSKNDDSILTEGMVGADNAEKTAAVEKFKKGLAFATEVRQAARTAAGL